ncbi:MAG: hypothetical protein ISR52_10430 [Rhodospirillales bacterium]|nr:hypothetical protein [Rhodospirillales bacterium]
MPQIMPQQKLLLELLVISGDIAVPDKPADTTLWRTINECKELGWLTVREVTPGYFRVIVTDGGRRVIGAPTGQKPNQQWIKA